MSERFIFATFTALNRPFNHDAGHDGVRRLNACASRAFNRGVRRVNALSQKGNICVARTHLRALPPRETEQAGGSRINFAAPASKKTRPRVGLFGGHQPRTPSRLSLRPQAGSEARRCAAVDLGGFGVASSHDITPMRQAIRASSPHELAHAVLCREMYFPAHDRIAVTSLSPQDRLMTSTHASGRRYSPMQ